MGSSVDVIDVIRPSEVRTAAAGGGRTQTILVVVLASVAGLSTLLALATVVRRRRSELAIHRVLGFTPGQVRATFLWQGTLVAAVAVVIGLPIGVGLGRTLWRVFADHLGVVPDPSIPIGALAVAAGVALLVGLLGSLGPAIRAARVSPAVGLRAE
jgi:ABC-type lipoprotein release transport system permease subunit